MHVPGAYGAELAFSSVRLLMTPSVAPRRADQVPASSRSGFLKRHRSLGKCRKAPGVHPPRFSPSMGWASTLGDTSNLREIVTCQLLFDNCKDASSMPIGSQRDSNPWPCRVNPIHILHNGMVVRQEPVQVLLEI